jgi:hypothetical protein
LTLLSLIGKHSQCGIIFNLSEIWDLEWQSTGKGN